MHTVILKREVYRQNPLIARSLYKAFSQAKDVATKRYTETAALHVTLPWAHAEVDRTRQIMGDDWWPYGIEKNRKTLDTFLRYHHEQGLSARKMNLEDLFAPETLDDEFKV
jgi:4,5-dihydroxyphthalate decarboxylase